MNNHSTKEFTFFFNNKNYNADLNFKKSANFFKRNFPKKIYRKERFLHFSHISFVFALSFTFLE